MSRLFETIRSRVAGGQYVVGQHAAEQLDERGVLEWQVVDGIEGGSLIVERPDDLPKPGGGSSPIARRRNRGQGRLVLHRLG